MVKALTSTDGGNSLSALRGHMKSSRTSILFAFAFLLSCAIGKAAPSDSFATVSNEVWSTFGRFVIEKHALEKSLAKKHGLQIPSRVEEFFAAEQKGNWIASSNLFHAISEEHAAKNSEHDVMKLEPWGPIHETFGTYEIIHAMRPQFVKMFGKGIVDEIPRGSIYFGGTAEGRFLISAFCRSHSEGQPFFTITQNALSDPLYLQYVSDLYGDKIQVADTNDWQRCFDEYQADVKARISHDQSHPNEPRQIKPGEDVRLDAYGKVHFEGQVAIMAINGLMAKAIFEKNPTREFYVEESFPLDWMFPHLTPSGLVMKINRAEIPELTQDLLKKDHEFWTKFCTPLIGDWITYDTSVKEVTDFAEKVVHQDNYEGFKGDRDFVWNDSAQVAFSKLRSSIAGIYTWRLGQPPSGGTMPTTFIATGANRKLIEREADFALKQALALCPFSGEVVFHYVQLLVNAYRLDDALLIAKTAQKISPGDHSFQNLIDNLTKIKQQTGSIGDVQNEIARLENAVNANPTNIVQQFELAQKYVQAGQNENAYKVLDRVLAFSDLTLPQVMTVANAYSQLGQSRRLLPALEKVTRLAPDSPEAWYDLAALRATLEQTGPAVEELKKSLALNSQRLGTNSSAMDIRTTLTNDERFAKLRDTAEYKAIVQKP
jgi:tetratricopeptide (TPR) repeat protein